MIMLRTAGQGESGEDGVGTRDDSTSDYSPLVVEKRREEAQRPQHDPTVIILRTAV